MPEDRLECLTTYEQFQTVREEWDHFLNSCFPEIYAKSHAWLSAWWQSYHAAKPALLYIMRSVRTGAITALAPLLVRKENFGGFPVRMLLNLGSGLGCDDFLIGPECRGSARILDDLGNRRWHVAAFRRLAMPEFQEQLVRQYPHSEAEAYDDFFVELPKTYDHYLKSRSSKFRNNLQQSVKRLENAGSITIEVLDPARQTGRVMKLCGMVARESWQYKEGKSHFNSNGSPSFFENMAREGRWCGGEEFSVLLCNERPLAYMLGCKRGRTYYLVDTAYDSSFRHVSVGRFLFSTTIERLINSGEIDRFDLEGGGEYKDYYATGTRTGTHLILYNRSPYSRWIRFVRGTQLYEKIKRRSTSG